MLIDQGSFFFFLSKLKKKVKIDLGVCFPDLTSLPFALISVPNLTSNT